MSRASISGRSFEDAGVARSSTPISPATAFSKGLNIEATLALAEPLSIPVIASGGLASIDDIDACCSPTAASIAGAITGRALYDGRLDPRKRSH